LADLPPDADQYLADARAILDALLKYGVVTQTEYSNMIQALGNMAQSGTTLQLQRGAKLVFFANMLEHIAGHDILLKAGQIFEIVISKQQVDDARKVIQGETSTHQVKVWLLRLIRQLFEGIVNGTYIVLPLRPPSNDSDIPPNLDIQSFLDLVHQCQSAEDIIVTDDRFWSGITRHEQAGLLTSVDLLRALFENEVLPTEEYYQVLMRFRRANIRYIPYLVDEIIYHLDRNYERQGFSLVETQPLETMRDYIRACLSQTEVMQLNPPETVLNQEGEKQFIYTTFEHISFFD